MADGPNTFKLSSGKIEEGQPGSKKDPLVIAFPAPADVSDDRWGELGVSQEEINTLAFGAVTVRIQAHLRGMLEEGATLEELQAEADDWTMSTRRSRPSLSEDAASDLGLSEEQIAALRKAGMKIG